jgi:type IV pilus assembly protein PilA
MKKSNKGFSLVELIIVIAIMAILIAVLAPQYLKYVEKTKRTTDASAFGEMVRATEAAIADPTVNKTNVQTATLTWTTAGDVNVDNATIQSEVRSSCGSTVAPKSKLFKGTASTAIFSITGSGDNWTKTYTGAYNTYIS